MLERWGEKRTARDFQLGPQHRGGQALRRERFKQLLLLFCTWDATIMGGRRGACGRGAALVLHSLSLASNRQGSQEEDGLGDTNGNAVAHKPPKNATNQGSKNHRLSYTEKEKTEA